MPIYDRVCSNSHELIDCYEPITAPEVACPECGEPTERAWLTRSPGVIQDSIEGGIWIRHGLCDEKGNTKKY